MHANDNIEPTPHPFADVPIVGFIGEGGQITITDPEAWARAMALARVARRRAALTIVRDE